jgi:hypothetical protein
VKIDIKSPSAHDFFQNATKEPTRRRAQDYFSSPTNEPSGTQGSIGESTGSVDDSRIDEAAAEDEVADINIEEQADVAIQLITYYNNRLDWVRKDWCSVLIL